MGVRGRRVPAVSDDPTFAKLRDELSKYNPSPETLEAIIATLEP